MERMQGQSLCNSCWIDLGWPIPGTCGFVSQMHMGKYKPGSEVKRIYTTQAQECLEAQQLESGREMWEKKTQSHLLTILDSWFVSPKYGKFSWYMCITITLLGLARLVVFPKVTTATISKCSTKYLWLVKWRKEWADCFSMLGPHLSLQFSSVQFSSSVVSDCLGPHGLQGARPPVHHQLPEFTQTQVHRVGDAIQPSHPLSSTSPPTFNLSQH